MSDRIDLSGNRGPLLNIAEWVTLVGAIFALIIKIHVKWTRTGRLGFDDFFIVTATLAAVGLCVTIAEQVQNGLGKDFNSLSERQINGFYLSTYLTSLFYILTTFLTKFASLRFFLTLIHPGTSAVINFNVAFVGLWMIIALFAISFQCPTPKTWDLRQGKERCTDQFAFWIVHGVMDILTQIPTSFLPIYLLWNLHARGWKKVFAMISFTPNILTVPLIILRLVFLHTFYKLPQENPTRDSWQLFLVTALHGNFSVLFATLPFYKPVVDALAVGVISNDVATGLNWDRSTAGGGTTNSNSYSGGRSKGLEGRTPVRSLYGWRKLPGVGSLSSASGTGDKNWKKSEAEVIGMELARTGGDSESTAEIITADQDKRRLSDSQRVRVRTDIVLTSTLR